MKKSAIVAFVCYLATIPLANWMIENVGTVQFPDGPHVLPVGFGLVAPSGVYLIGFALVARDVLQMAAGRRYTIIAILAGTLLAYAIAPAVAVASGTAFLLGELADFAVYTPLAAKRLHVAVLASGVVGAMIDSFVFLTIAFGTITYWQGNTSGKIWMSLLALPFLTVARRVVSNNPSSLRD